MHIIQTLRHWRMSFANFTREISNEIHQMEGHLEMAKFEIAFENFSHLRNFNLDRLPTRIRPQKKISLYFSTTFSRPSKVVRFLTLPPFERAFEPSPPSSAPSSPRPSFWVRLWALIFLSPITWVGHPLQWDPFLFFTWVGHQLQWDPFFVFFFLFSLSTWVGHPLQWDPFFFFTWVGHQLQWDPFFVFFSFFSFHLGRSSITMRPLASFLAFYHWAGRLEQWDHLRVSSHFIIKQVAWNNETTCEILRVASSYQVGRLEQLNHSRNPFHVLFFIGQVTWKNKTTREILRVASSYRAGRLEQLDHSWNPFRVLFFIGRVTWKNETTHEILRVASSYRAGRLEQLDHSPNPFRVSFFIG